MPDKESSTAPIAVIGSGSDGIAALINVIVRVAYETPDGAPPVTIIVCDEKNKAKAASATPYPLRGSPEHLHPFASDVPPTGFPSFAQYVADQSPTDPALANALEAPTWGQVNQYLDYLLELASISFAAQVNLEINQTPIREIRETEPGGAATLLMTDGTSLQVRAVVHAEPPLHMAAARTMGAPISTREEDIAQHAARQRLRDWSIINAGTLSFWSADREKALPVWTYMAGEKPVVEDLQAQSDLAPTPWLETESTSKDAEIRGRLHDPPTLGTAISYPQALGKLAEYLPRLGSRTAVAGRSEQERVFRFLLRVTRAARTEQSFVYAIGLIPRLHEHRWVPGSWATGYLLIEAAGGFGPPFENRAKNPAYVFQRIKEVMALIQKAKDEVRTLTEWAEALYRLSPAVRELMLHLRVSPVEKALEWHDYFNRVMDEIYAVHLLNSSAVRRRLGEAAAAKWSTKYLTHLRSEKSAAEFRQQLKALYEDHVTLPKFWHDAASALYDAADESIPESLDRVDAYRAISIFVLEHWSDQWRELVESRGVDIFKE